MNRQIINTLSAILVALIALSALFVYLLKHPNLVTTYDFSAYYASFQLFAEGKNPYDVNALDEIQKSLGHSFDFEPAKMWYAPWSFVILGPVLSLGYHSSAALWFCLNIIFLFASGFFIWRSVNRSYRDLRPCIIATALFFPLTEVFAWNQISLFVTLGFSGFLWSVSQRKFALAGMFLVPMTLKPHVVLLIAAASAVWIVRERRWGAALSCAVLLVVLSGISLLEQPSIFNYWLENSTAPPLYHRTPTLAGLFRGIIYDITGSAPIWPALIIPGLATLVTFLVLARRKGEIAWSTLAPALACLSPFFSPYSFVHDQSLMLVTQVSLVAMSYQPTVTSAQRSKVLGLLILLQAAAFALRIFFLDSTPEFFWYPVAMYVIWLSGNRLLANSGNSREKLR